MSRLFIKVLVAPICAVGLVAAGYAIGTARDPSTSTAIESNHSTREKWWHTVEQRVSQVYNAESTAFTLWSVFCVPGTADDHCSAVLPDLRQLRNACAGVLSGVGGGTLKEARAMNALQTACEVNWLAPRTLDKEEFTAVLLATSQIAIVAAG